MLKLYGIAPPEDPCEECELREELDKEQQGIRQAWSKERLKHER